MIDPNAFALATEHMDVEFGDRDKAIVRERLKVQSNLVGRGMTQSSAAVKMYLDLFCRELRIRANLANSITRRVLYAFSFTGSPAAIVAEVSAFLAQRIDAEAAKLKGMMTQVAPFKTNPAFGSPGPMMQYEGAWNEELAAGQRQVAADLKLWEVMMSSDKPLGAAQATVTVYGNNNIIQAAVAGAATIRLSQTVREDVRKALAAVKEALQTVPANPSVNPTEIADLIDECDAELQKEVPNRTRLAATLPAIADAVQTVASVKPAWETLRGALILMGVPVP